ncbi:wax ester/triacylglycerol synthase domain-containing protein [Actinokineospora sp. HUAS TT18]|uniref:wax ester/triacylglycerol synthase domain-containing protein n=1 Tax=Actinokineospora sp. HUAS TT18 TaxID=3447451 RepID=UPI003F526A74
MTEWAGDGEFMRSSDAFSWYQESDPALRSTIVGVAWLDRVPDWAALCAKVDAATRSIPRFRQRVEQPPARLAPPRWAIDGRFDLSWHLRRVAAPAPHGTAQVLDLARLEAMTGFDRSRPLWTFTLVERVDRRAALIMKVHHSLTDGQGAMRLAPKLFDGGRTARAVTPPPAPEPDRADLLLSGLLHTTGRAVGLVVGAARGVVPAWLGLLRDPLGTARDAVATVRSIAATVAPVREAMSPVMRDRGLGRGMELLTVSLDDLKAAAGAAGGTVNDAFLAAVTGGLRHYHDAHRARPAQLRVTMPISIRTAADPAASNRITLLRFPLPVAEPDPVTRMAVIGHACQNARSQRSLAFTDAIAGGLDLLPSAVAGSMLKRVDFLASDVTGLPRPVYLAGSKVTAYCAFGPTMGCAANLTLMSYAGACHIGVTYDTAAIPDADLFAECLRAGFAEITALAGSGAVHLPVRDSRFPGVPHRSAVEDRVEQ